ncbi:MAG: hypothetical protein WB239_05280 [Acidimicrobiia bacterium]
MNAPSCVSIQLQELITAVARFGRNKAHYPLSIAHHDSKWWVNIELNTTAATVDFEASHADLDNALANILARVLREATVKGLPA